MIALIQRATSASVRVEDETAAAIGADLIASAVKALDNAEAQARPMLERPLGDQAFADETGRMNRALTDTAGGLLLVHWLPIQEGLDRLDHLESGRLDWQTRILLRPGSAEAGHRPSSTRAGQACSHVLPRTESHSEIARELDMPLGSVKSSLRRSFAKLQGSMRAPR
ncbi:D-aminoacyl-tRNA deacylase [Rhodanobacter lindaniclasticus]